MDFMFDRVKALISTYLLSFWRYFCKNKFLNFISRLTRYLYPTDQELKNLVGAPKEKHKKGKHTENGKIPETFQIPRSLDITLETAPVSALDVVHLKFYSDFQWLLDFSIYGAFVYIMTEVSFLRSAIGWYCIPKLLCVINYYQKLYHAIFLFINYNCP